MSAPPGSASYPRGALIATGGPASSRRAVAFQYNPQSLQRSLQAETEGASEGDRSKAVRFVGAPVETFRLDAYFDATDALGRGDETAQAHGIYPQLSALALLIYPSTTTVQQMEQLLSQGQLEVVPALSPELLFVWGKSRIVPVRVQGLEVQEQFFDANLNPIQARVTLTLRVLSYSDLQPSNPGYHQFIVYQQTLESLGARGLTADIDAVTGVKVSTL